MDEDDVDVENDCDDGVVHPDGTGFVTEWDKHPWNMDQSWQLETDWPINEKDMEVLGNDWQEDQHHMCSVPTKLKPKPATKVVWCDEEKATFLSAFDAYPKMWSKIATLIPSKTLQQVRNYGRKYVTAKVQGKNVSTKKKVLTSKISLPGVQKRKVNPKVKSVAGEVVHIKPALEDATSSSSEIDIEDCSDNEYHKHDCLPHETASSGIACESLPSTSKQLSGEQTTNSTAVESTAIEEGQSVALEIDGKTPSHIRCGEYEIPALVDVPGVNTDENHSLDEAKPVAPAGDDTLEEASTFSLGLSKPSPHLDGYPVMSSKGEIVYLPNPTAELQMDRSSVSREEKLIHSEFFDGKSGVKNENRYLKIRNYILDSWEKCRSNHLNKTSVRTGLRSCGDVNCIGRVHRYLEQIGAINFGSEKAQYNQEVPKISSSSSASHPRTNPDKNSCREASGFRKRRVRDEEGHWVPPEELEGKTILHIEPESKEKKVNKSKDPFKLIPCEAQENSNVPYKITFEAIAVSIMDIHSQLSHTEVAGLLGGVYIPAGCNMPAQLVIKSAVPCLTDSTHIQCDIDPVSQLEACDKIVSCSQTVVGWYHSHPTFDAKPSIRDLDTQYKYQEWYGKDGSPYIGAIVSPWIGRNRGTDINSIVVRHHTDGESTAVKAGAPQHAVPHLLNWQPDWEHWSDKIFIERVTSLITHCSHRPHRVALTHQHDGWGAVGCLNKVLEAADKWLPPDLSATQKQKLKTSLQFLLTDIYADNCN